MVLYASKHLSSVSAWAISANRRSGFSLGSRRGERHQKLRRKSRQPLPDGSSLPGVGRNCQDPRALSCLRPCAQPTYSRLIDLAVFETTQIGTDLYCLISAPLRNLHWGFQALPGFSQYSKSLRDGWKIWRGEVALSIRARRKTDILSANSTDQPPARSLPSTSVQGLSV